MTPSIRCTDNLILIFTWLIIVVCFFYFHIKDTIITHTQSEILLNQEKIISNQEYYMSNILQIVIKK